MVNPALLISTAIVLAGDHVNGFSSGTFSQTRRFPPVVSKTIDVVKDIDIATLPLINSIPWIARRNERAKHYELTRRADEAHRLLGVRRNATQAEINVYVKQLLQRTTDRKDRIRIQVAASKLVDAKSRERLAGIGPVAIAVRQHDAYLKSQEPVIGRGIQEKLDQIADKMSKNANLKRLLGIFTRIRAMGYWPQPFEISSQSKLWGGAAIFGLLVPSVIKSLDVVRMIPLGAALMGRGIFAKGTGEGGMPVSPTARRSLRAQGFIWFFCFFCYAVVRFITLVFTPKVIMKQGWGPSLVFAFENMCFLALSLFVRPMPAPKEKKDDDDDDGGKRMEY